MSVRLGRVLAVGLFAVCLIQVGILWRGYVWPWMGRAWRNMGSDAMQRNADFLLGARASRYMDFLSEMVPLTGSVVLPTGAGEFSEQSILQFFLLPRTIPACPCSGSGSGYTADCAACLREAGRYVPSIGDFPPGGVMEGEGKEYLPYPEDSGWFHGLWLSQAPMPGVSNQLPKPIHPLPAILLDVVAYAALAALGAAIVARILHLEDWHSAAGLGFTLGAGLVTLVVFQAGQAGVPVRLWTFGVAWALLMIATLLLGRSSVHSSSDAARAPLQGTRRYRADRTPWPNRIAWACITLILLTAALVSITRGYSRFDAIANWALKGHAIAYEGSVMAGARWGGHGLAYPQHLHLLIALFRLLDGDALPGSKLIDPLTALGLALSLYGFWRWAGVGRLLSSAGVGVILTTPVVFEHTTLGYANFMFAGTLAMGSAQLARAIHDNHTERAIVGGILLGMGAWTRPEGGVFGLVVVGVAGTLMIAMRSRIRVLVATAVPFLTIWWVWLSFGAKHQMSDEVGTVLRGLVGRFPMEGVKLDVVGTYFEYVVSRLLEPSTWGVIVGAGVVLVLAGISMEKYRSLPARGAKSGGILLLSSVVALMCLAMVGLGFYQYESSAMLVDSFDRDFIPAAIVLWTAVVAWAAPRLGTEAGEIGLEARLP